MMDSEANVHVVALICLATFRTKSNLTCGQCFQMWKHCNSDELDEEPVQKCENAYEEPPAISRALSGRL